MCVSTIVPLPKLVVRDHTGCQQKVMLIKV